MHRSMTRLLRIMALVLTALLAAGPATAEEAAPKPIRLGIVNTPKMSGLIDDLIADFKATGGRDVSVYSGSDVYEKARAGAADLVISHFGKADVERFVLDGYGSWPKMVFANQIAIMGPKSDPAGIRGLTSAAEALKRIAASGAPFVVNGLPGIASASDVLWLQAGSPAKGPWYLDPGVAKGQAMRLAEDKQAYTIWGVIPFLKFKDKHAATLDVLVTADPYLQRVMAATVVNPDKIPGTNPDGARAFQTYLLSPRAQARIAAFRQSASPEQLWWPAARHNANEGHDE